MLVVIQGNIKALLRCFAIEYLGKQKKTVQAFLHLSQPVPTHKYLCKRISTSQHTRILVCTCQHAQTNTDPCMHTY